MKRGNLLSLARLARQVARKRVPDCTSKFAPKWRMQPWLLSCVCLNEYLKLDCRGSEGLLASSVGFGMPQGCIRNTTGKGGNAIMKEQRHNGIAHEILQGGARMRRMVTRREFAVVGMMLILYACSTAPVTGRRQLMLLGPEPENALGIEAYSQVLRKEPITHDPRACCWKPMWPGGGSGTWVPPEVQSASTPELPASYTHRRFDLRHPPTSLGDITIQRIAYRQPGGPRVL